jgi:murein DD-endopeptidase MepM/ murein hydrolase activator NlpD
LGSLVAATLAALALWPQGGVFGQDLYYANSVDLDPAAGATLDPWCGHRTYDTHSGVDVAVRSFREVQIGVPVFSVSDGTIAEVQDGMYDFRFGPTVSTFDNHLIVKSADGRFFVYGHLRHGLKWKRGDTVRAGQQIAWGGSSGNSSWPHLHFTELVNDAPVDPFAGKCNPGPSGFVNQPEPFRAEPYVRNVAVSAKPFTGRAQLPWDEAVRTGTFVRGMRDVYVRYELGEYAGGAERVQVVRPDGSLAVDDAEPAQTVDPAGGPPSFAVHQRVRFDVVGAWRLRYVLDGKTLADTPLRVVAKRTQIRNRPPFGVTATVTTTQGIAECVVSARIDARDPDYDVVRYRYRWTVGGKVARTVTSAMLSDYVAVPAGQVVHCAVTPSDGKLAAATASS